MKGFFLFLFGVMCLLSPVIIARSWDDPMSQLIARLPLPKLLGVWAIAFSGMFFIVAAMLVPNG